MQLHYRQGDVLLVAVPAIPEDARPLPRDEGRVVLALGEATGHAPLLPQGAYHVRRQREYSPRALRTVAD
jgi:hypothetical protein